MTYRVSKEQYEAIMTVYSWVEKRTGKQLDLKAYNLHYTKIGWLEKLHIGMYGDGYLGPYLATAYYSPVPNQPSYPYNGTLSKAVEINCGRTKLKDGSLVLDYRGCEHAKFWPKLTDEEAGKIVACPKEMPSYAELYIGKTYESRRKVVCRDWGGAITSRRLDIWAGYGWQGVKNMKSATGLYERGDVHAWIN